MPSDYQNEKSESRVVANRRYWSRTDSPKPWYPWGLLQLIGLAVLFLVGAFLLAPRIEADVRTQVSDRLRDAGVVTAVVSSSGQGVSIRASADETNKMVVQTIAGSTRCRTWAGQLACPTTVNVELDAPTSKTAKLELRPHPFKVVRTDEAVTLSGEVPNLSEQERILVAARQHFDTVLNEMDVTNAVATDRYIVATTGAIAAVSHLQDGQAEWSGESLSVIGFAGASGVDSARREFDEVGRTATLGVFNVSSSHDTAQCNEDFERILAATSVQFKTGSALIDQSSESVLKRLAEKAATCPGELVIEGHTDSRGGSEMNRALSQERAASVRSALVRLGVEPGRLSAVGYGEQRPVADNDTADGRATNRRIVISTQLNN